MRHESCWTLTKKCPGFEHYTENQPFLPSLESTLRHSGGLAVYRGAPGCRRGMISVWVRVVCILLSWFSYSRLKLDKVCVSVCVCVYVYVYMLHVCVRGGSLSLSRERARARSRFSQEGPEGRCSPQARATWTEG